MLDHVAGGVVSLLISLGHAVRPPSTWQWCDFSTTSASYPPRGAARTHQHAVSYPARSAAQPGPVGGVRSVAHTLVRKPSAWQGRVTEV